MPAVEDCHKIGYVRGFSGFGKVRTNAWREKANRQVVEEAREVGATHIVWNHRSGINRQYATATAYRCIDCASTAQEVDG